MSFTAKELYTAIVDRHSELEEAGELEYSTEPFQDMWDDEFDPADLGELEGIGKVEIVEITGGQGDGAPTELIIRVGERYFEIDGYYSSWDSGRMDGELYEVQPEQVTVTRYKRISND